MIKWVKGDQDLQIVDNDQTNSLLNDLKVYLFVTICMTMALFFMLLFRKSKSFRSKIDRTIEKLKTKFRYNGMINSFNISYMESLLTVATQLRLHLTRSEFQKESDKYSAFALGLVLFSVPGFVAYWLRKNSYNIGYRSWKSQYEALYMDIHNYRNKYTKYYIVVSMVRRILFVLIPVIFQEHPAFQVQLLQVLSISYVIWYGHVRPHIFNRRVQLEMFNEAVIMCFNYHMIIFSDFCFNPDFQFSMGYVYVGLLLLCIFVHMGNTVITNAAAAKRQRKLEGLKINRIARLADLRRGELAYLEERKRKSIKARKERLFLEGLMKEPEKRLPITMPFKIKKALVEANERKEVVLESRKEQKQSLKVLRQMTAKQRKKYNITKKMETILELSDGSLCEVDIEIENLKAQQIAQKEDDPEIQKFKEMAELNIEKQLQYMKKYYDPNAPMYDPERR